MKLEVAVTEEDIDAGCNDVGVYNACPVARALIRLGCEKIDADEDRILLTWKDKRYLFKTPRDASLFIDDFDHDREIGPIQFILEKPKLATPEDERQPIMGMRFD
jgi:hypothetical protein